MKRIIFLMAFLMTAAWTFTACEDEDVAPAPKLSFAQSSYNLVPGTPLEIVLNASTAVQANTTVPFTIGGDAEEGTHYTLSAKKFEMAVGQTSAKITVTPLENYAENLKIKLTLNPVAGFELGANKEVTVTVGAGEKLIYSFVKALDALSSEVIVGVELKDMEGNNYIAPEEIRLPFSFAETSTAVKGTHFSVEGDVTEFVIPQGKRNATIKLKYIQLEEGKDEIVMKIDAGSRFMPGNYEEMTIKIYGPTTVGKLMGKWVYESDNIQALADQYLEWEFGPSSDYTNAPVNNSTADTLEFVGGEKEMLNAIMVGDAKNYFRNCELTYLRDTTIRVATGGIGSEEQVFSLFEMSKANVAFSGSTTNEREALLAIRLLEDGKTLEISVFDFEPVDFFQTLYQEAVEYEYWLMWDNRFQYIFTKVEESAE